MVVYEGGMWDKKMKKKRVSYRKETIKVLEERYGYSSFFADQLYKSMYNRAYKLIYRKTGKPNISIARNLFYSTISNENQLYFVDFSSEIPKVNISSKYLNSDNLEKEFIKDRFFQMAQKYDQIQEYIDQWDHGNIDYDKLIKRIENFKKTNEEYLIQDYKFRGYKIVE